MDAKNTYTDDFDFWLASRPKWLQTAAARLLGATKPPSLAELEALADLCQGEASKSDGLDFQCMPAGAFGAPLSPLEIRIDKIDSVRGLNAIRSGASLSFEDGNLTIVYGSNGVGKTGFSRLLKQICGARHNSSLLPNVFSDECIPPSAEVDIVHNGNKQRLSWSATGGPLSALKHVHVFDGVTAASYVNEKNEASYETRRLRFISALIKICDQVTDILDKRRSALSRCLPALPVHLVGTPADIFLQGITHRTGKVQVDKACAFSEEDRGERIALEVTLKETNFEGRLTEVRQHKQQLSLVSSYIQKLQEGLSSGRLQALLEARADAERKRQAATEDARKAFANAPLAGIGESSWRLLWEQARAYSQTYAYPALPYPVVEAGASCVLCQQSLDESTRERLANFETFVKGALEAQAKAAERLVDSLISAIPTLPGLDDWRLKLNLLGIEAEKADAFHAQLTAVHQQAFSVAVETPIHGLDWSHIQMAVDSASENAARQEKSLLDAQDAEKRGSMKKRLAELQSREWLSQQRPLIESEILRQTQLSAIDAAIKLAKTAPLTAKKTELMTAELAQGYQERFASELRQLGGSRIPVEPMAIPQGKGRISFQLTLKGAKQASTAQSILSDGENRIVALAAFLADMTGLGFPAPFIFDDPISSLDQDFEERVVARLVDLSKSRQVIVFTHRLSLVALVESAQRAAGLPAPRIETLRRVGESIGVTDRLRIREKKPKAGFNALKDSLAQIRKLESCGPYETFEANIKAACSDFRILIEKTVESVLLNEIVLRFRRDLQTKGKLEVLTNIRAEDCSLIDEMMTKYSRFEHSQSDELPISLPSVLELDSDISSMLTWIDGFTKR